MFKDLTLGVTEHKGVKMKTITEKELMNLGRAPRKTRISLKDGTKQVHIYSDEEILQLVRTGRAKLSEDAEWLTVVPDEGE